MNQLSHGDSIDESYLVADKQLRANRQGNLYLQLELRDKTGSVGARLWNASEELARTFEPGDFVGWLFVNEVDEQKIYGRRLF